MSIELHDLRFAYPDTPGATILDIPRWSVAAGERLFVHGPSGSGKSTLLGLLSGILPCQSGHVDVLGQRLDTMQGRQRDRFRANHIGYVFQQFNLIPYLDARENIELARHFCRRDGEQDSEALLAQLGIAAADQRKPTARLSIGQQQRVAIARALVNGPELLIADEPTSSLDTDNRDAFMSLLMAMATEHGFTLLFVSHDLSLGQYFDRIEALDAINHAAGRR